MKIEDVKVGMKVVCVDALYGDEYLEVGKEYVVSGTRSGEVLVEGAGPWSWMASRFEPAQGKFPLANTKINVQKYADDNGITLAQAHEEVQEWLFGQGYEWFSGGKQVVCEFAKWVEIGTCGGCYTVQMTWSSDGIASAKEITLQRTAVVTLTPSFVEEEAPVVELNGKQYRKADLEAALAKLTPVGEWL